MVSVAGENILAHLPLLLRLRAVGWTTLLMMV